MPQLSPMLGFFMFTVILFSYFFLLSSLSKKAPFISSTKVKKTKKVSLPYFSNL
uniref:ATP synthase F0 subunit 8 n=1 Tax=Phyllidia ocellata TaxID=190925 RepID=A0A342K7X0_9GAST|nr:ATP synthase F0 subunit 8 [Phyllidia ocellata]AMY15489.1 ATP synthase F0 subunit 8 [Phyllidia ocellata]WNR50649.1 ATP synthase F0 subunit 8 [Phyllidia ocellata]